jgi:hypothetical protein
VASCNVSRGPGSGRPVRRCVAMFDSVKVATTNKSNEVSSILFPYASAPECGHCSCPLSKELIPMVLVGSRVKFMGLRHMASFTSECSSMLRGVLSVHPFSFAYSPPESLATISLNRYDSRVAIARSQSCAGHSLGVVCKRTSSTALHLTISNDIADHKILC